jgi:hypothetical protein
MPCQQLADGISVEYSRSEAAVKGNRREPREGACPLTAAKAAGSFVGCQSFKVELGKNQGFSESLRGSASQLQFQRRLHELSDSKSESCKIADIPCQQNICSRFKGAMTNQRVIGGCTDDSPRGC